MKFRTINWLIGITIASLLISSCNIGVTPAPTEDPGAIQTQAFEIVLTQSSSLQTQTAAAIPPTPIPTNTLALTSTLASLPTPFPLNTQQPGFTPLAINTSATVGVVGTTTTKNGCNDGYLISESTPIDGKSVLISTEFTKSWEFLNVGTCTWDEGYSFAFIQKSGYK